MDITRSENQNNLRIGSLKFKLEFAGNLKSYYLPLIVMLYVISLHLLSYIHLSSGYKIIRICANCGTSADARH